VLRISSGLFTAPTPATFFHRVFADNGTQTVTVDSYFALSLFTLTAANTSAPHELVGPPAGLTTREAVVIGIAPGFRNPRSLESSVSVERHVSSKLEVTAGYIHSAAWRLERKLDANLPAVALGPNGTSVFPATRPIAGVGRLLVSNRRHIPAMTARTSA